MQSFPWRPRMRGVVPSGRAFTVLVVDASGDLGVAFEPYTSADAPRQDIPLLRWVSVADAAPDLDDAPTLAAFVEAIGEAYRTADQDPAWVTFAYYSSTRGQWRIEARKEGREHRGVAKCLGEGVTRKGAALAAWRWVSA